MKNLRRTKLYTTMSTFTACAIAEGFGGYEDATEAQRATAWQWLHDSGNAYRLQGWYGRTANYLVSQGIIIA